jgi:hypothetical protein
MREAVRNDGCIHDVVEGRFVDAVVADVVADE